jgi:2-iminobutanoate/2-iminopropanoate deaminase
MRTINTAAGNQPLGHYSQAVEHGGTIYVATQLGRDRESGAVGSIEQQTSNILNSIEEILEASGSGMDHVLRVTIYVSDISFWGRVNEVYSKRFGDHRPARGVIPCNELHNGCQVAMDVIAAARRA